MIIIIQENNKLKIPSTLPVRCFKKFNVIHVVILNIATAFNSFQVGKWMVNSIIHLQI